MHSPADPYDDLMGRVYATACDGGGVNWVGCSGDRLDPAGHGGTHVLGVGLAGSLASREGVFSTMRRVSRALGYAPGEAWRGNKCCLRVTRDWLSSAADGQLVGVFARPWWTDFRHRRVAGQEFLPGRPQIHRNADAGFAFLPPAARRLVAGELRGDSGGSLVRLVRLLNIRRHERPGIHAIETFLCAAGPQWVGERPVFDEGRIPALESALDPRTGVYASAMVTLFRLALDNSTLEGVSMFLDPTRPNVVAVSHVLTTAASWLAAADRINYMLFQRAASRKYAEPN